MKNEKHFKLLCTVCVCVVLGGISAWDLWEQDLFWQIRAGADLWHTGQFSVSEQWSYTAQNQEWFNFQWLSNLLYYFVFNIFGVPGLVWSRALLLAALLFVVGLPILKSSKKGWLWCLFFLPLFYISIFQRIQLRSEFLVLLLFGLLVTLRSSSIIPGFLISIAVANMHPGLLPFLFLWQLVACIPDSSLKWSPRAVIPPALVLVAFLITPYPLKVWSHLFEHVFYYQSRILGNPEHQSFGWGNLNISVNGMTGYVWLLITGFSISVSVCRGFKPRELLLIVLFTSIGLFRDRAIPFAVIAMLPLWVFGNVQFFETIRTRTVGLLATFSIVLLIFHVGLFSHQYHLQVSPETFPVEEVNLLNRLKPKGNVFHTPSYGSYLLTFGPHFKIFMDTRETPFLQMQQTFRNVLTSPESMKLTLNEFGVGSVIWPAPFPTFDEDGKILNTTDLFFPKNEWAVCHLGIQSMILIRKTADGDRAWSGCEYKTVSMDRPVHELIVPEGQEEVRRCLKSEYPNISCLLAAQILSFEIKKRSLYGCDYRYLDTMELYYSQIQRGAGDKDLSSKIISSIEIIRNWNSSL